MSRPAAYEPAEGYRFQILVMSPGDRAYEHCDYATDRADRRHLLDNYRSAYGPGFTFKTIKLSRKFWPKKIAAPAA